MKIKNAFLMLCGAVSLMFFSAAASASNFSYSYLGFNLGKLTPDEDIVFLGEVYEEFGTFSLTSGYQFNPNMALFISSSAAANEGPTTELSTSSFSLGLMFPVAVGEYLDIVPGVGFVNAEVEGCSGGLCASDDESGAAFGLSLRGWAVAEVLEVSAQIQGSTLDDSETFVGLGGALWWAKRHSARLDFGSQKSQRQFSIGYRYTWR